MRYDEIKKDVKELRDRICDMCYSEDANSNYDLNKDGCRRIGDEHDCKPQAILDGFEKELLSYCD